MAGCWKDLQEKIEKTTQDMWLEIPEELIKINLGALENKAGSYGQYFSTIDHANGMVRDFANTMYQILKSFMNPDFTFSNAKILICNVHPSYIDYLRYSNYLTWSAFDKEFISLLDDFSSKEDLIEFYKSYLKYVNKLTAWAYHYFPWELGVLFPYRERTSTYIKDLAKYTGNT